MPSSVLLMMMMCLFGNMQADGADVAVAIVVKKITLDIPNSIAVSLMGDDTATDGTTFSLVVGFQDVSGSFSQREYITDQTMSGTEEQVFTFALDGDEIFSKKEIIFILNGEISKDTVLEATLNIILDIIPDTINVQWVGEKINMIGHGKTLRINEDIQTWKVCDDGEEVEIPWVCHITANKPCYAINIGTDISADKLSICKSTTDDPPVPIIVKKIPSPDSADTSKPGPPPNTITLDSETKLIATTAGADATKEAVVYLGTATTTDQTGVVCDTVDECDLTQLTNGYNPPAAEDTTKLNIITITIDGKKATGSSEFQFQDYDLNLFALEKDVLEARWADHSDTKIFTAIRNKEGGSPDTSYTEVNADCTHNKGYCYAYYINVATDGEYTVTLKPRSGEDNTDDDLNIIKSAKKKMNAALRSSSFLNKSLGNVTIGKQFEKDSGNLELNVCFTHDSRNELNNTQLEIFLINAKKQWKRVMESGVKQADQGPCYSATFMIGSEENLHSLLTALVIQREVNSGEVLSYHRSDLDLSAIRAIKPEVDNGNNGSTSTLTIVGAAIAGIACLMALVAAAIMFVLKINRNNDGLQYPLHRTDIEDSNIIHGLDNPIPTM